MHNCLIPMHRGAIGLAVVASLLLAACNDGNSPLDATPARPIVLTPDQQRLVIGSNGLAMSLFRLVDQAAGPDSNVFISPLSASVALGMTALGANGATLDSMRAVLGYPGMSILEMGEAYHSLIVLLESRDPLVDFQTANAIWYSPSITVLPSFTANAQGDFGAHVSALDFTSPSAPGQINQWVDAATDGRIPQLVGQLPPDMRLFLANAIYFHGSWRQRFDPAQTRDTLFTTADGERVPVTLMTAQLTAPAVASRDYTAADLAYGNGAFAMTVIVPTAHVSLDSLVGELADGGWAALVTTLDADSAGRSVGVALPKFTLTWGDSLRAPLSALGMAIAFSDVADFSNMSRTEPLRIDGVVQRTYVAVDADGTTAAGATGVGVGPTVAQLPLSVRADHAFVYAIRERSTGAVLFVGAFAHPPTL